MTRSLGENNVRTSVPSRPVLAGPAPSCWIPTDQRRWTVRALRQHQRQPGRFPHNLPVVIRASSDQRSAPCQCSGGTFSERLSERKGGLFVGIARCGAGRSASKRLRNARRARPTQPGSRAPGRNLATVHRRKRRAGCGDPGGTGEQRPEHAPHDARDSLTSASRSSVADVRRLARLEWLTAPRTQLGLNAQPDTRPVVLEPGKAEMAGGAPCRPARSPR